MRILIILSALFVSCTGNIYSQDSIRISGQVTDFNYRPIDSVWVSLKNKNFDVSIKY